MKDLTKTVEITAKHAKENEEDDDDVKPEAIRPSSATPPAATAETVDDASSLPKKETGTGSGTSTPRPGPRLAIANHSHNDQPAPTPEEIAAAQNKEKRKKKGGLTKEQLDELDALDQERKKQRAERVNMLTEELIMRLSIWTETDKSTALTLAFNEKIKLEAENLKMESFGVDILHSKWNLTLFVGGKAKQEFQQSVMSTSQRDRPSLNPKSGLVSQASSASSRIREPSSRTHGIRFHPPSTPK
jgi:hypothetical protein